MSEKKIKIIDKGPYVVEGGIPLFSESVHTVAPESYEWAQRKEWTDLPEKYLLCRCGKSKNMPFCDHSHERVKFKGTERATRDTYKERAVVLEGKEINMADDMDLCSWTRFCHTPKGKVWKLLDAEGNEETRALLMKGIQECPSGRLVAIDKETGEPIEPDLPQEIVISQDPEKECSGPIMVRGGIPLEAPDGYIYEVRNRMALCRCGRSHNTPFCDSRHYATNFDDGAIHQEVSDETHEE